jgi:hypothetical protein
MAFDPLSSILTLADTVINKLFPDKTEAEKAKVRMAELAMSGQLEEMKAQVSLLLGQMNINSEETKHASWMVAGWRPFSGWVCGGALAYTFILQPFLSFLTGWQTPALDMGELMTILMGMLGLAGARTYEKTRNGK